MNMSTTNITVVDFTIQLLDVINELLYAKYY